jgi:hypothetical protein
MIVEENGIMLSRRWTDTILWEGPSRIQGEHHSILWKHWRKWLSSNLPARCQTNFLAPTSNLTWPHSSRKSWTLMPLRSEYNMEINIKDVERFLFFPSVICTPRYDWWFRSYVILKLAGLLKFRSGQVWAVWEIWASDPKTNTISRTSNHSIVDNFLSFQTYPHATYLV